MAVGRSLLSRYGHAKLVDPRSGGTQYAPCWTESKFVGGG